ncbi:hypothetical protein GCM10009574_096480 [Streptomyces asiaticus]|uniref:Uncharacterized protein n=2 Tax=Streptomyces rhizosphaericus TaxID=114699 RepID=A0ABN1SN83_9ACTN
MASVQFRGVWHAGPLRLGLHRQPGRDECASAVYGGDLIGPFGIAHPAGISAVVQRACKTELAASPFPTLAV